MALTQVPIELSSTPGIVDNSNATAITIDSSENVGIGTTSPSFSSGGGLQVQADTFSQIRLTETGNTGLDIAQASDAKGYVYLRDNSDLIFGTNNTERMRIDSNGYVNPNANVATNNAPDTQGLHFGWNYSNGSGESLIVFNKGAGSTGGLSFVDNSDGGTHAERMRIDSSGHLIVPNGVTLGTAVGTYAAANTLDDYEEGTWTPAYTTTNSDATVAYQTQRGRYIKIGNFVSITWYVEFGTVTSAGSGSVKVTGVPFQAQSNNDSRGTDTFYNVDYDSTNFLAPVSYLPASATSALQFLLTRDAGSWSVASTSTMTVSTNDIISGSMVFRTA